ncbi:MAG: peptidoglycan recognition family protein [Proteobacteria bacterium]|nr:peptidoglycan recognition family protein [Pseudomonadota bacterium]
MTARWRACLVLLVGAACSRPSVGEVGKLEPAAPNAPRDAPVRADVVSRDAAAPPDATSPPIVDAPMAWSAERAQLTLDYRRRHVDAQATDLTIEPRVIVLHYTAGGSAEGTRAYFDAPRIEAERAILARAGAVNVSSHFVVDRDGTIFQLQPETRFARHCIGLNHVAIGIENVGDEARWPLTDAQVAADAALIRALVARHPITHLVGHHEVTSKRGRTPYYVEREADYHNDKPDPGDAFMAKVRAKVADLDLAK